MFEYQNLKSLSKINEVRHTLTQFEMIFIKKIKYLMRLKFI